MLNKQLKLTGIIGGALLLAACTQTADEVPEEETEEVEENDETTEDGGSDTLTIYTAGPGGMAEALAEAFEEESGIDVDLFQSTTGDVLGRLEAEQGNPVADVVVLASLPPAMEYKESGLTHAYESEYADQLHEGWFDEDYHFYGFSAAALGLSYNTEMVDNVPEDWIDLAAEEFTDEIAIPDPSESGTARDFVTAYVEENGWELFEELEANGLNMAGANAPALDSVINGSNQMVMAGVDYMVYSNMASGEPVDIVFPESGTTVTPRPAFILESSQNIDAAEQYIDFILSDAGQQIVADAYLLPAREDVDPHEDRAPVEEIPALDVDWATLEDVGEDVLAEFLELMR